MRALTMVGVLLLGVAVGQASSIAWAQRASPKVLVIDEVDPADPQADAKIAPLFGPVAAQFGGHYLVRGGKAVSFSGEPPKRLVVIEFENIEKAREWRESPRHKELEQMRTGIGTKIRSFAVAMLPKS